MNTWSFTDRRLACNLGLRSTVAVALAVALFMVLPIEAGVRFFQLRNP